MRSYPEQQKGVTALRPLHWLVGIIGVVAFLTTGAYMDRVHDHLRGYDDTTRMLFRSTHVYVLLSAASNVMLGLYLTSATTPWRRLAQGAGSLLILFCPGLFVLAFCTEPYLTDLARPWTKLGVYLTMAGVILHLLARVGRKTDSGRGVTVTEM